GKLSDEWFEAKPTCGKHSQEMPARKNQHVAFDAPDATENTIGAPANLFRRFSVGTTVAKQLPVWSLRVNLDGSKTFIIAVVSFDQIGIDLGCRAEAR